MISRDQCRAARAGLGWSLEATGRHAGISASCVMRFELHNRATPRTMAALEKVFADNGVEFAAEGGRGVVVVNGVGVEFETTPS